MLSIDAQSVKDIVSKAPSSLLPATKYVLVSLLPSFIRHRVDPSRRQPTARVHPTSWLDGLRGIAALIVLWYHIYSNNLKLIMPVYGHPYDRNGMPAPSSIMQLPFLRVLLCGRPMVHIFFIVSGYALSLKTLKQARSNDISGALNTISSSVFRRGIRLYLPLAVSTFIGAFLLHYRVRIDILGYSDTTRGTLAEWESLMRKLLDFWNANGSPNWAVEDWLTYEQHTWTIPLEMTNSLILFLTMISLARVRAIVRIGILATMIHYCFKSGQWVASEFIAGMIMAEFGLIQDQLDKYLTSLANTPVNGEEEAILLPSLAEENELKTQFLQEEPAAMEDSGYVDESVPPHVPLTKRLIEIFGTASTPLFRQHRLRHQRLQIARIIGKVLMGIFSIINLIIGLYIFGWPEMYPEQSPNFTWMILHTPAPFNSSIGNAVFPWYALGAVQIVFACQQLRFVQYFLTASPIRYLGRISYSLYLMHWDVFKCMQGYVFPPIFRMTGTMDGRGRLSLTPSMVTLTWFLSLIAITPVAIWVGDLFCSAVDDNVVRFARWVEEKCLKKYREEEGGGVQGGRR